MRSVASRIVAVLLVALGVGAGLGLAPARAAEGDLQTEPTTKVLTPDPGTTTLTPTPATTTKRGSTPPSSAQPPSTARPSRAPSDAPSDTASAAPSASASDATSDDAPTPAPSASASVRVESSKTPFERRKVPLGVADLAVSFKAPTDWPELPKEKLPEVPPNPDATLVVERGFGVHDPAGKPADLREVVVVCGKASADYWADNIRDAAFTEMVAAVETEAKKYSDLSSIDPEAERAVGDRIEQPFAAEATLTTGGAAKTKHGAAVDSAKLQGVSFIGFYKEGSGTNVIACSVACANLVEAGGQGVCGDVVGSLEISGAFVPAPKRSWLAQVVFGLRQNPTMMWLVIVGGVFALLLVVIVPLLLLRRRRAHATGELDAHDDEHDEHDEEYQEGFQAGLAAARAAALSGVDALHASQPPAEGYYDPTTLTRRG